MSQNTRESLSVLMDSESDELELRRVLKALPSDDDAADTWRRYHLARSMMRRERNVDVSVDLSAGVMACLQSEPVPASDNDPVVTPSTGSVSFARGAGVAAAVSLMVITGVQFFSNNGGALEQGGNEGLASSNASASNLVQPVNLAATPAVSNGQVSDLQNDMPMFEQTPFRMNGLASGSGLMNVSEGGFAGSGSQQGVSAQQGTNIDIEQLRMLQSYLEQQTQGAVRYQTDQGASLMQSTGVEPLGQR